MQDRASWLEFFKPFVTAVHSGDAQFQISFENETVPVYGDTAVVTGGATFKGQKKGVAVNNVIRFTNMWVKRRGTWQLVSYRATPIDQRQSMSSHARPDSELHWTAD